MTSKYTESAELDEGPWVRVNCSEARVHFTWPDLWPFHDFQLTYEVPLEGKFRLRFLSERARRTYLRSLQTGGYRETTTNNALRIELTAGLRARFAGGYLGLDPLAWARDVTVEYRAD